MVMVQNMALFDKIFLTGCDAGHQWILPWFLSGYTAHNDIPLVFADFGVTVECKNELLEMGFDHIIDMTHTEDKGWFKKPKSMIEASKIADAVCWIDTDIEILKSMKGAFVYVEPNRIAMVEDKPWTKRMGNQGAWYNSGVVAFEGCPDILSRWSKEVEINPTRGDQETLHFMLPDALSKRIHITDLPNEYNWLRLQLEHDNQDSKAKKAIHWTGEKGKDRIRSMIKNG